jgi:HEAT repeat protein
MSDVKKIVGQISLAGTVALTSVGAGATVVSDQISVVLDRSAPERTRIAAAMRVSQSGARDAVIPMVQALQNTKGSLKAAVRKALGELNAASTLQADLTTEDAAVRQRSAELLGVLQDTAALGALVERLKDSDAGVREAAAIALAKFGGPDQVQALTGTLCDDEVTDVRMAAAQALGEIDAPSAKEALVQALKTEKDDFVKVVINMGLKSGD